METEKLDKSNQFNYEKYDNKIICTTTNERADNARDEEDEEEQDDDVVGEIIEQMEDSLEHFREIECGGELKIIFKSNCDENNDQDIVQNSCGVELSSENSRMRVILGILIRLVVPFVNGVTKKLQGIRGARVINTISNLKESRGLLTSLFAYAANSISMSLSSVQVVHKINPLLKAMKLKRVDNRDNILLNDNTTGFKNPILKEPSLSLVPAHIEDLPEKCVTLNVLAEPPEGVPIRADVILIHGLHGSLVNTWKQGQWNSAGRRVRFERPPKPPVRPPKRPKHSRSKHIPPSHHKKRARIESPDPDPYFEHELEHHDEEQFYESRKQKVTYICDEPGDSEFVDEVEFSFPTYRFRIEDDNEQPHHIQAEYPNKNSASRKSKGETFSKCWPGEWLPLDCPGVRVIALNYTTDPYLWRPIFVRKRNRTSLVERSREMTEMLVEKKVGVGHPIIWVGHSKGGIFVKQIIVDAWESGKSSVAPLWRSSRGVLFYSVPHRGSPLADFNLPLLRQSIELTEIKKNCPGVLELHRRFVALYRDGQLKIRVFSFVETALTLMSVLYLRIVGVDSADPGIGEVCGVHLDHREICKPRSRDCILYTELTKMINKVS